MFNPPHAGEGFCAKTCLSGKAEPIAVTLARLTGKPVKIVYCQEADFIAPDTRHGGYVNMKLGAKKDGALHAIKMEIILNSGAYRSSGAEVPGVLGAAGLSLFPIPHRSYSGFSVYTNRPPAEAIQGFGNTQGICTIESVLDMIGEKLCIDMLELHAYPPSSTEPARCIKKGAKSTGWERSGKMYQMGAIMLRGAGPPTTPPWHAHFAEIEVDRETGLVHVIKVAADTPEIRAILAESADFTGPFGAKGVRKCNLAPTAAIANAVYHALGIRFTEISVTPESVFKRFYERS